MIHKDCEYNLFYFLNVFKPHKYLKIILPFHSYNNTINDLFMSNKGITKNLKTLITVLGYYTFDCSIHIVPTILNIHTIDDTIQYLINEGIKDIKILKLVVQGRCEKYPDIELDDNVLEIELNKLKNKYGDKVRLGLPFSEGECVAGKEKLVVMSNGEVIPCESYKSGECKCKRMNNINLL